MGARTRSGPSAGGGRLAGTLCFHAQCGLYKERNRVECFFNRIKHFRRIATGFEKHAQNYLAMIKLASIRIWMRHNESMA
jgi:hypothetical protein